MPEIPASSSSDRIDWHEVIFDRDSFIPVLGLAVLTMITFPFIDVFRWGALIAFPTSAGLLVMALYRSRVKPRTMRLALVALGVVGIGAVTSVVLNVVTSTDHRTGAAISSACYALLFTVAFPSVVRRALQHRRVTLNTLAAAISAYLIIGLWFAMVFRTMAAVDNWQFFGPDHSAPTVGTFIYFSFITLTTVGYGDLVPATAGGRSAAITEAVLGQVYLVTTVARVVSLLGRDRPDVRVRTFGGEDVRHDFGDPGVSPD